MMQSLKARILGDEYAFRSENIELTQAAIDKVNALTAVYRQKTSEFGLTKLAVLTAINLAEQNIDLERRLKELTIEVRALNEGIANALQE